MNPARPSSARPDAGRGYTIVEMAIVLAVIGMLLGSILYPLSRRFEAEAYTETRDLLAEAEEAIIGYAMRNTTTAAAVLEPDSRQLAFIPAGRPFLPCPDLNGDGKEDRNPSGIDLTGSAATGTAVTIAVDDDGNGIELQKPLPRSRQGLTAAIPFGSTVADNSFMGSQAIGACTRSRGLLPWATLGLPRSDYWGNLITYRPHPAWANSIIGFGSESRIAQINVALPLTRGEEPDGASFPALSFNYLSGDDTPSTPAIVCEGLVSGLAMGCSPPSIMVDGSINLLGTGSPLEDTRAGMIGRSRVMEGYGEGPGLDATFHQITYDVYPHVTIRYGSGGVQDEDTPMDVLDGMAFVLVSHGKDTRGGFRAPFTGIVDPVDLCDDYLSGTIGYAGIFDPDGNPDPESANFDALEFYEDECSVTAMTYGVTTENFADTGFVTMPRALPGTEAGSPYGFDDEVRFMGGAHLLGLLRQRGHDLGGVFIQPIESL